MTKSKGVALILSIIILTAVLAIALTASKVFTDKIKMSRSTSDSMKAYYAAESGIEYALYQIKQSPGWVPGLDCSIEANWTEVDGAKYCLEKTGDSIKAIGKAGSASRGIEVEVAQAASPTGPSFYWTAGTFDGATADTACASGYHICNTSPSLEFFDRGHAMEVNGASKIIFDTSVGLEGRIAWINDSSVNCKNWTTSERSQLGAIYRFCYYSGGCTSLGGLGTTSGVCKTSGCMNYCDILFPVLCCSN